MKKLAITATAGAVVALVAACGGGDGSVTVTPNTGTPNSANQSAAGLASYLETLSMNLSETAEPVDLSNFAPQTSETDEPVAVSS